MYKTAKKKENQSPSVTLKYVFCDLKEKKVSVIIQIFI